MLLKSHCICEHGWAQGPKDVGARLATCQNITALRYSVLEPELNIRLGASRARDVLVPHPVTEDVYFTLLIEL
jgi:hypothetical protein